MQTIYYSTSNFIHHTGNVVDLNEYRRKLALAEEGSLAPQPEYELSYEPAEAEQPPILREVRPRRSARRNRRAWVLELCTSLSVLVMTMTFTVRVLTI